MKTLTTILMGALFLGACGGVGPAPLPVDGGYSQGSDGATDTSTELGDAASDVLLGDAAVTPGDAAIQPDAALQPDAYVTREYTRDAACDLVHEATAAAAEDASCGGDEWSTYLDDGYCQFSAAETVPVSQERVDRCIGEIRLQFMEGAGPGDRCLRGFAARSSIYCR